MFPCPDSLKPHYTLHVGGVALRPWRKSSRLIIALCLVALACVGGGRYAALTGYFAVVQVALARAQLERAKAEVPIASLERQIAAAEARARRLTLYAPIDGRILNIKILPGEAVGSGPVLIMGDTGGMRAVAEVYETDIPQVRIGQVATISSRALPHSVTGKVVRIGEMVFKNDVLNVDPAARADARVVEVWTDLDKSKLTERLTDLTVDVIINTDDADGAVASSGGP
jgi:HlyD family secretion protein